MEIVLAGLLALPALGPAAAVDEETRRREIKATLLAPDPLPPLAAETHGRFEPAPGVVAERVTYATQFGLRVPAILYLPKLRRGKAPALIVVNGHGGDKYSWYAFYSGILYARAGAVVLTYDPAGEGERNIDRKSGTRAHDKVEPPEELARRLAGLMITDVRQAVSYLAQRPEVDAKRIAAAGYSLGSFVLSLACAVENRLKACVLVGGGNLDGPGEYWDNAKPMCVGIPYRSLMFLGDRPAVLYALHAARGATLVYNGLEDATVRIPPNAPAFFRDLQRRVAALRGSPTGVFETGYLPGVGHRPFFVTRPVALWLERQLDFPNWSADSIATMGETHIGAWARENAVELDPLYSSEHREGGTRALGTGVPALPRQDLSVFAPRNWELAKARFIHEAWLEKAKAALREGRIVLVEDGRPRSTIVVGPAASQATMSAAGDLQKYVEKISGARVPISAAAKGSASPLILVGASEAVPASLGAGGFRIRTAGGNLVLAGKDDAGTQSAVYALLEKHLGVRWLWPGELGEVVPQARSIALPQIDETRQPDFKWRNRGPGGALWGAPSGPTAMRPRERLLGVSAEHQAQVALWERRNGWGGLKIYGGHALGEIFPPAGYAGAHPEYYALVDGKRAVPGPDYDFKHGGQVCTTNPGVIRATIEWVRKFFDDHPGYDGVHITMNDGGGICECDRCRALDSGEMMKRPGIEAEEMKKAPAKYGVVTDRIFTFVNQVAAEVEQTHPGKYVVSMAYSRYAAPPRRVRLRPSVVPQYCLWSAYRHANAVMREEQHALAALWARAGGKPAIYEYYINGSWPGFHRLVVPQIAASIKTLRSLGIDMFQTQSGDDFAINGINYYVAGKLLWDASLDPAAILADFYERGFGRAAPAVRRFHARLEEAWRTATAAGEDVTCNSIEKTRLPELFTPELLEQCARDLAEASRLADNELIGRRVEFYRQGLRYTELTVAAVRAARRAFESPRQRQLIEHALQAWTERDRFVEGLKDDFVVAYFWARYNDLQRDFHPSQRLRELLARVKTVPSRPMAPRSLTSTAGPSPGQGPGSAGGSARR